MTNRCNNPITMVQLLAALANASQSQLAAACTLLNCAGEPVPPLPPDTVIESITFDDATRTLTITAGGVPYTATIPDTNVTALSVSGNVLTITQDGLPNLNVTIPAATDVKVVAMAFDAGTSTLSMTSNDTAVQNVTLPTSPDTSVNALAYNSTSSVLTATNSDGTTVDTTLSPPAASKIKAVHHSAGSLNVSTPVHQDVPPAGDTPALSYTITKSGTYRVTGCGHIRFVSSSPVMINVDVVFGVYVNGGIYAGGPTSSTYDCALSTTIETILYGALPLALNAGDLVTVGAFVYVKDSTGANVPVIVNYINSMVFLEEIA